MSLQPYNRCDLQLKKVYISGRTGKSAVFQAAAESFLPRESFAHGNVNAFYYIPRDEGCPYQIYLNDLDDIDGPHADFLTTPYREADCIILVYDPTVHNSLVTICRHFSEFIYGQVTASVLLLRNMNQSHDSAVLISLRDQANMLSTNGFGNVLGRQLHSVNTGRTFVYSVLSNRGNNEDVEFFFNTELIEFLMQRDIPGNIDRGEVKQSCFCRCLCYLCCCLCSEDDEGEDDEQELVIEES